MRYLKLKLTLSAMLIACMAQASTYYYIRMPDSTYSAQLRGVTGTTSAGQTLTGTWVTGKKAHRFTVTKTGPYKLYADPAGGSSYVLDSAWSGTNGKAVAGDDLSTWMLKLNSSYQVKSNGIGDTSIATAKIKNQNVTADKILDSTITLAKLNSTALDYIGSAGEVTNLADDVTLEDNGSALQIKDSGVSSAKMADHAITYAKLDTGATGFVDVRKFGAVGDGVTDDTDAIQAAIDYAHILGGGTVFFPNGTYLVSKKKTYSCLVTYTSIKLVGTGRRVSGLYSLDGPSTIIMADNQNTCIIVNEDYEKLMNGETPDYWHYSSIENLTFFCNGDSNLTSAEGIKIYRPGETSFLRDINVIAFRDTAITTIISTPAFLENISCFPASTSGSNERVAMKLSGRTCRVIAPSGDECNPYFYIYGEGSISIMNPKLEFNLANSINYTAIYLKSSYNSVPSVDIRGGSFYKAPISSRNGDLIYVDADSINIGKIHVSSLYVTGFKNIVKTMIAGIVDSVYIPLNNDPSNLPERFIDNFSMGDGINYISGDYTYSDGVFVNNSPVFTAEGLYANSFYSPYLKFGEKQNYVKQSEDFSTSWQKAGTGATDSIIVTTNAVTAPDGKLTADMITNNCKLTSKYIYQNTTDFIPQKGEKILFTIWVKGSGSIVGKKLDIFSGFYGGPAGEYISKSIFVPDKWTLYYVRNRCSVEGRTGTQVRFDPPVNDDSLYVWGAQLNSGWKLYPYTATTTSAITSGSQAVGGNFDFLRLSASDSSTVGSGGIWQRNWYYNVADSSVAMVFYNTTLARIDTVFMKQP